MSRFYVFFSLIAVPLYAAQQPTPWSPSEVWGSIIKRAHPNSGVDRLKLRGTLQVVSKSMAEQQPTLEQLLAPEEVEKLLWELDPIKRPKTVTALAFLNLEHEYATTHPDDGEGARHWLAKNQVKQLFDYNRRELSEIDIKRAECLAKPFLLRTKNSGELTYSFVRSIDPRSRAFVRNVLELGDSPNYTNKDGNTTLHEALQWHPMSRVTLSGDIPKTTVEYLLEKGADLNIMHKEHGTAFKYAIQQTADSYFQYTVGPIGEWSKAQLTVKRDNLTAGQKLVIVGIGYGLSSDKVPQIFNKYLPAESQLSPQQITKLCALKSDEKKKYLAMSAKDARAYEDKMNSSCSIL